MRKFLIVPLFLSLLLASEARTQTPDGTIEKLPDGSIVVRTGELCKDFTGYMGATPLEIRLKDGVIEDITALPNEETPQYFARAKKGLFPTWLGKTAKEAKEAEVDAVTGATYSSEALIENLRAGLQHYLDNGGK